MSEPVSPYPIRPVTVDELPAFFTVMAAAFGDDATDEDLAIDAINAEPERTLAAFDGSDIVGTAGAFTFVLSVPGARAPAAGVTYVSVAPTHRRRGVLSSLMRRQLDDLHERGEPIAVLWASEAAIYGRFGYGLASQLLRIELDRLDARLRHDVTDPTSLRVRQVRPSELLADIEHVERTVLDTRPGQFERDKRWIELLTQDPDSRRGGMSKLKGLVVEDGDDVVGYALFRMKNESLRPHMLPNGEVLVMAQAAVTPTASAALTRTLLAMDLMRRVRWWNLPVDTPLPHLFTDERQARTTVLDALHLRVVDVADALARRRYAADVDVVLEVDDALCRWNHGRWHLRGDRTSATCVPTDADAGVRLSAEALGAAYLGGTRLTTLAAAGRVAAVDAETLSRTSVAFGWDVAPWCPVIF